MRGGWKECWEEEGSWRLGEEVIHRMLLAPHLQNTYRVGLKGGGASNPPGSKMRTRLKSCWQPIGPTGQHPSV